MIKQWGLRLLKKCWMLLAIVLIVIALIFSIFRALTPWATQYKGDVEQHLSTIIGQPVVIHSMETSWYWWEPVLKLNQVTVFDSTDHVLKLAKLMVGINVLSSLWHGHLQPGILMVDDVHLTVHQIDNHWQIDGLRPDKQTTTLDAEAYLPILSWVLGQQKIIIKNASALIHLSDGRILPFGSFNLTATNHQGHYRLKGKAQLVQTLPTALEVLVDVQVNPNSHPNPLTDMSGRAYVSVHDLSLAQWQHFFPPHVQEIDSGQGSLTAWVDVVKSQVTLLQTTLDVRHIKWKEGAWFAPTLQHDLQANVAWTPTEGGWQLSADHILWHAGGFVWPENSLQLHYQQKAQAYRLFVNVLLLEPLLATTVEWPAIAQPWVMMHPRGQLNNTQLEIKKGQLTHVLSSFNALGWQGEDGLRTVSNLSGVLNWWPTEGRLELDGEHTTMTSKGLPPLTFTDVNAAFSWNTLADGLHIDMERLVLNHPDLVLKAHGDFLSLRQVLQLTAEFSAQHVTRWLAYLPSQYVKSSLDDWLKHDIQRIDHADGQLTLRGPLADFPFDHQEGIFSMTSHLSGMDFVFDNQWPPVERMDMMVNVDKRTMDMDVRHAALGQMEASAANLHIDDLGLGRERLLLHGKIKTRVHPLKDYIFASPLRKPFKKLEKLDITGSVVLDLSLEVPLYPENDEVLADGGITFDDNKATFHHVLNDLQLTQLSGWLLFDERGVTNSELQGTFMGEPVLMHIKPVREPSLHTEIMVEGETTMDLLRNKLDIPIPPLIDGRFNLTGNVKMMDASTDIDNIEIKSSLKGVRIDLPVPYGKSAQQIAPLTIQATMNATHDLQFHLNYDHRLAIKVNQLGEDAWGIDLSQQDIAGFLRYQPLVHTMSGHLSRLYVQAPGRVSQTRGARLNPMDIPNLDINVDHFKLGAVELGQVAIKSSSTPTLWRLDDCRVQSADYVLTMKGAWSSSDGINNTSIDADVQMMNLERSLARWNITPVVEAHKGQLQFKGGWAGAINDYSWAKLNGQLFMSFQNGRITNLSHETEEKLGLGKLLSILSLQTIPRRLKLDFSDLSNPGYSFDILKGDFSLKQGVLSTTDSYIDGPVAYASMKGDLDLAKQGYAIDLHISPHITASLPIVATIAGGPIAGMVAWVASKIINQGMQQVTGYTYRVSGPWSQPEVTQVSIYKKKT